MEVEVDLAVGHLYSSIHALDPADHIDAEIISRVANVVPRIRKKGGQQDFTLGAQEVRQDMNMLKRLRQSRLLGSNSNIDRSRQHLSRSPTNVGDSADQQLLRNNHASANMSMSQDEI